MKTYRKHFIQHRAVDRFTPEPDERGSATVVFISLLAIMMILVTAESRALIHLRRETRFLEQQQIKRLNASQTNTMTVLKPFSQ